MHSQPWCLTWKVEEVLRWCAPRCNATRPFGGSSPETGRAASQLGSPLRPMLPLCPGKCTTSVTSEKAAYLYYSKREAKHVSKPTMSHEG